MKSSDLVKLNFIKLIDYNGMPEDGVQNNYSTPIPCNGFCIDCEQKGFLDNDELNLDQMSHGADSWEALILISLYVL